MDNATRVWRNWQTQRTQTDLSARRETGDVELLKFGEAFQMVIPSQARTAANAGREGVETRRAAPKPRPSRSRAKG